MKNTFSKNEKDFLKKLGEKIRGYRIRNDLSQEKLAFKANLDRTYISGIERGERNISVITLKKVTDALDVNISDIFNIKINR